MYVITTVDAALDVGGGRVGVGAVVRNDRGVPIFAAGVCLIGGAESTKDIKALLSVADVKFFFPRGGNKVAHEIARWAVSCRACGLIICRIYVQNCQD
ncbi:hypothetical protein LWI29_025314 [Acer saccharum]|uniref:Uncharacterized protein n=1 Tax=Acer saccharum TaxID=4024 RepID=A0AA39W2C5_ACESA|nr:hypothetical protein LWI29_025314 [Acer saccharum]